MRKTCRALLPLLSLALLATCAEGLEAPAPTRMAEVTTNLTFSFGVDFDREGFCSPFGTNVNSQPSCTLNNGVSLPVIWPQLEVQLAPFAIDIHEVTNFQYEHCVASGACERPRAGNAQATDQQEYYGTERFRDYPVVLITWEQAKDYCEFVGKRLPTEFEWERVAKGPDPNNPRRFPTEALDTDISLCRTLPFNTGWCRGDQRMDAVTDTEVDFVEEGSERIYFLFGNAAEWVSTSYERELQCKADPPCPRAQDCPNPQACVPPGESCYDNQDPSDCPPAVRACIEDAIGCLQQSSDCAACTPADACHYLCEDSALKRTIVCSGYPASELPLDGATLDAGATGSTKAIRGGSVELNSNSAVCNYRSTFRDRHFDLTAAQPWLGFRCARTL